MTLNAAIANAIYSTVLAEDAIYTDALSNETEVRIVREQQSQDLLPTIDVGVTGQVIAFRLLLSSLTNKPQCNDTFALGGDVFRVDYCDQLNEVEWICYVIKT